MRTLLTFLCVLVLASAAAAEKPVIENPDPVTTRVDCPFDVVTYDWNFNDGDYGFTTDVCDPTGGEPVWAYGTETNLPGYTVWGTVLDGNYPSNSGEALVSPMFTVGTATQYVQIVHYYDTEFSYDGLNLVVNGDVVAPMDGYDDDELSDSTTYYAFCVDGQPGFSGHDLDDWMLITSCFDLSAYLGLDVDLRFQFGSDSSVQYPGWYLASVQVGGFDDVATEPHTWSSLRTLYR